MERPNPIAPTITPCIFEMFPEILEKLLKESFTCKSIELRSEEKHECCICKNEKYRHNLAKLENCRCSKQHPICEDCCSQIQKSKGFDSPHILCPFCKYEIGWKDGLDFTCECKLCGETLSVGEHDQKHEFEHMLKCHAATLLSHNIDSACCARPVSFADILYTSAISMPRLQNLLDHNHAKGSYLSSRLRRLETEKLKLKMDNTRLQAENSRLKEQVAHANAMSGPKTNADPSKGPSPSPLVTSSNKRSRVE